MVGPKKSQKSLAVETYVVVVSPVLQIDARQNGRLARHSRIPLRKWQMQKMKKKLIFKNKKRTRYSRVRPWRRPGQSPSGRCCHKWFANILSCGFHSIALHKIQIICLKGFEKEFKQMTSWNDTQREGGRPSAVLVPKSVAVAKIFKSFAHDAAKDGADHGADQGPFGDAGRPQINVVRVGVDVGIGLKGLVGKRAGQVVPGIGSAEAAELAEGVVAGQAVIPTPLHIERRQIVAPTVLALLEQMVRQLPRAKLPIIFPI